MGEEIAFSLKNVSKCYKRYARPVDRLIELLLPGKSRCEQFWALRDINLEVAQGETLGIIGQNGSGKSTLLQIIAGTLTPTEGEVQVNGRVSALLELGSGFNPEFTGRQNVFFNGQILGLSVEEIEAKYDDITAFAEIGDFINQPVKTYSSGMVVRLAFAVVANTEPKILIVDEALAVGDAKFQFRCMKRIRQLKEQGVTILFVSHDSSSVKMLCQRAALMNYGRMLEIGNPKEVVNHYTALLSSSTTEFDDIKQMVSSENNHINTVETYTADDTTEIADSKPAITEELPDSTADGITKIADSKLITGEIATFIEESNTKLANSDPTIDEGAIDIKSQMNLVKLKEDNMLHRHGNKLALIRSVRFTDLNDMEVAKIETGIDFRIEVLLEAKAELSDLVVGVSLRNLMGLVIYGTNTRVMNVQLPTINQGKNLVVTFRLPCYFNRGVYTITVGLHSEEGVSYDWIDDIVVFEVFNNKMCDGIVDLNSTIEVNQPYNLMV